MFSKGFVTSGLCADEVAVWSKLSPGISPSEWASFCREIGSLSSGEFSTIVSFVSAHKRFKHAVKQRVEGMPGDHHAKELPLVSAGPSGIGGEYQKEITLKAVKVRVTRQKQKMPFARMVFK